MNIQEATMWAVEQGKSMTRTDSPMVYFKITPTDTDECCIISVQDQYKHIIDSEEMPRWNPSASDLLSNKWEVVD